MAKPHQDKPTALYRLYDAEGSLLYIGITYDLSKRWTSHSYEKTWWHLVTRKEHQWFEDRTQAEEAEKAAVAAEHPRYDATHRLGAGAKKYPRVDYSDPEEEIVLEQIRSDILAGSFPEGRSLPRRAALAERYRTSIRCVGSALYALEREFVLESSGHRYWVRGQRRKAPQSSTPVADWGNSRY